MNTFLLVVVVIIGLYYSTGFPLGIIISRGHKKLYTACGIKYPAWLHAGLAAIPLVGFWILFAVLKIEEHNFEILQEHMRLVNYRKKKAQKA